MQCVNLQPTKPERLDVFLVELVGEFDFSERDRLLDAFGTAGNAPIVFANLEKASYLDSTALGCLAQFHATTQKRGGRLILLGVHGTVQRLIEVLELNTVFDIRGTLSDLGMASIAARRMRIEARTPVSS
ncbi:MAG: STAS domain-containing protein [Candidatus Cybelea sp.]